MTELNKGVFPSFQQNLVQWYKEHKRELPWRLSQDLTACGSQNHAPANPR